MIPDLQCVRTPAAIVSSVPDEQLPSRSAYAGLRYRYTGARDRIAYPGNRRVWFQSHTGGAANGEYAQFDPHARLLGRCVHGDTVQVMTVEQTAGAEPAIPRGAMTFSTKRGLHIGSPVADVQRVYGKAQPHWSAAGRVYAYERDVAVRGSSLPFVVRTVFFVRNKRVVAIVRLEGF